MIALAVHDTIWVKTSTEQFAAMVRVSRDGGLSAVIERSGGQRHDLRSPATQAVPGLVPAEDQWVLDDEQLVTVSVLQRAPTAV